LQLLKVEKSLNWWETWQAISEDDSEDQDATTQSVLNLKTWQAISEDESEDQDANTQSVLNLKTWQAISEDDSEVQDAITQSVCNLKTLAEITTLQWLLIDSVMERGSEVVRCVKCERVMETASWSYLQIQSKLQTTATKTTIIRFDQLRPPSWSLNTSLLREELHWLLKKYIIFIYNI
jgi:hypothetical protein